MKIFNVNKKEIDQVKKETELKPTNPLKINKRKRKQKDIIIKLIENLPNRHKDKKENLLNLEESIDIPIVCIRCKKYGHHVTECQKQEKDKKTKEKTKKIDIKPVSLQDLMSKAKMIKQEIKEDNSTNINKQNIAEIINLKEYSKPMIDPPSLGENILDNDNNK